MSEASERRGPPPIPGLGAAVGIVFRMQMRRLARGRKLRLGVISCALVVFAVVAARYASERDVGPERAVELAQEAITEGFSWGFFKLLAFLLPFLFTSAAIAEEVENRTFAYLSARPVGRFAIALGKLGAGALMGVGLIVISGLLLHVVGYATEPSAMFEAFPETLRVLGSLALLTFFYSAVCMLWGALTPEAAGVISGLYLGVIEFLCSFLPGYFRCISMNFISRQVAGYEPKGLLPETAPEIAPMVGVLVIGTFSLFVVFFACLAVRGSEYRFAKA